MSTLSTNPNAPDGADTAGFGVYIHWPFCASKCPYCDFNSHVRFQPPDEARFLAAFQREIATTRTRIGPRKTGSVFFGGGTPSLMKPATVEALIKAVDDAWLIEPGAEITLEANPSSVEAERFRGYRSAGVNRVSLGVQSLRDADLKALGRLHSVAEAKAAIEIARATFDRFTFDLIYARMGQTERSWELELAEALQLGTRHLSLYQLTIEPETPFASLHASGKLTVPDPDLADRLYVMTSAMTTAAGLPAYEISNYATAGEASRHNLLYWRYGEYAGIGPGAHGRILIDGQRHATSAERSPEKWRELVEAGGNEQSTQELLSASERVDEALLMGLRLVEGIELGHLQRIGGLQPSLDCLGELEQFGVLERLPAGRIRATPQGRFILNELVLRLSRSLAPAGPRLIGPDQR